MRGILSNRDSERASVQLRRRPPAVKVEEYLDAGVPLVWVISPDAETVAMHRADCTVTKLHNTDVLTGEAMLPGFQCKVSELFVTTEDAASDEA